MAFERRHILGSAIEGVLDADIDSSVTAFNFAASPGATGWPTGGANGKFSIVIDPDTPFEEHIDGGTRTGLAVTGCTRGVDGTSPVGHVAGAKIRHTFLGIESDWANQHYADPTLDHHTQYMKTDGTRHDLAARHTFAGLGWAPGTPASILADAAGAAGSSAVPARSDHSHPIQNIVPVAVGTALAEGADTSFARGQHVHVIGVGAINAANMFAAGVVDAAAIGANAVGTSELADDAVTGPKLNDTFTLNVFTASGTWNKPAGLRYIRVRVVGGGGSGGGVEATSSTQVAESGGGGGGGYSEEVIPAASLGATVAVTVGAGGAPATAGNNPGNAGGSSGFGAFLTATGGAGGAGGPATASGVGFNMALGGAGGVGSAGDINLTGERGGRGILHFTSGGVGYLHRLCEGGGNPLAGRTTMNTTSATSGVAGQLYGGGSTGAENGASQAARASLAGADGIVIVEEYA